MLSNTETEELAVATALSFPGAMDEFLTLKADDFTAPKCKKAFEVIREVTDNGKKDFDIVLFKEKMGVEDREVSKWMTMGFSETYMEVAVRSLKNLSRRRAVYLAAQKIFDKAGSEACDTDELIAEAGQLLDYASEGRAKAPEHIGDIVSRRFEQYQAGEDGQKGIKTGWADLDDIWAGFYPGELTVLAGRPSMGKTAFAQALSEGVAFRTNEPVLVYSLEMSSDYLGDRYISGRAGVDLDLWRRGRAKVSPEAMEKTQSYYSSIPLYLQDQSEITTYEIQAQARKMQKDQGLSLVVVDFLTLLGDVKERGESEHLKVSAMCRRLRAMAKSLNIPVLVLAQVSRAVEHTEDKRPRLSHLKESGGIEEAADNVLFIYREGYYFEGCEHPNKAEIIVAKQKQGPRNITAPLYYDPETGRFRNLVKGDEVA